MKIANYLSEEIDVSLEPEGTLVKLKPQQFLEITGGNPEVQIRRETDYPYLQVWLEDNSMVIFKGEKIR
jgi:hypothetical protein